LSSEELLAALAWFRTLPMWLDLDGLRVVHACWNEPAMARISQAIYQQPGMSAPLLQSACRKGKALYAPVEIVLKGQEVPLPDGQCFYDNDIHKRTKIRCRWYLSPQGQTYRSYALQSGEIACDLKLEASVIVEATPYPAIAKPVFIGHYGLSAERPEALADNVACLDFSVANGGFLCGYRWQGEQKVTSDKFVWVKAVHV
jgi:hypothetical protein